ncbi:hypothetical protein RJT34_11014 [Clitoria ternatea]|uniref:Uncharacterized protein n=1 Tax=Clitoria ternatea TaxID=43366 RepID=A0AAN9JJ87_CLITE
MMQHESLEESEAKSTVLWKLKEEHTALGMKLEQLENENVVSDKGSDTADTSWKDQYGELIEKFNTPLAHDFITTSKKHGNTDDGVTKYEKVGAVLKGKAQELQRLYDNGIEGYKKSQEFQDLMSAMYLNGLRDGILEAQAIVLAVDMETTTSVFKENEEPVVDEAAKVKHVDNENHGGAGIPDPTSRQEKPSNSSGSEDFDWQQFSYI